MLHAQGPCIYGDRAGPGWPMSTLSRAEWAPAGLARRDAGPGGGGWWAGLGVEIGWSQRGERGRLGFGWRVRCSPGGSAADSTRSSPGVRPARLPALPRRAGAGSGGRGCSPALAQSRCRAGEVSECGPGKAAGACWGPRSPRASREPGLGSLDGNSFWREVGFLRLPRWGVGDLSEMLPKRAFHLRVFTWARRASWVCSFLPGCSIFWFLGRCNGLH